MIQYLQHNRINREKWDECIDKSVNGLVYAKSWYLDIVSENWSALIENDYESVMPITFRKKWGVQYIYPPFFTQQLGVFSIHILDHLIVERFLQSIPKEFRFIECNMNSYNYLNDKKFTVRENANHLLELNQSYNYISKGYSDNLKRNLKKAFKLGVVIKQNTNPHDIIDIFIQNKGKEIKHLKKRDYQMLKKVIDTGISKGMVQSYGVYTSQDELCGGAVFLFSKNSVIFLFSATNTISKKLSAMPLLVDRFIKNNAEKDLILDFEGSNDSNLARFYKNFGSKRTTYPTITINKLPFYINFGYLLIKRIKKII